MPHKKSSFLEMTYEHVGCEDIHAIFFLEIFDIYKYVENAFQIKGAYTPKSVYHTFRTKSPFNPSKTWYKSLILGS
jgi:hypothetical protein